MIIINERLPSSFALTAKGGAKELHAQPNNSFISHTMVIFLLTAISNKVNLEEFSNVHKNIRRASWVQRPILFLLAVTNQIAMGSPKQDLVLLRWSLCKCFKGCQKNLGKICEHSNGRRKEWRTLRSG